MLVRPQSVPVVSGSQCICRESCTASPLRRQFCRMPTGKPLFSTKKIFQKKYCQLSTLLFVKNAQMAFIIFYSIMGVHKVVSHIMLRIFGFSQKCPFLGIYCFQYLTLYIHSSTDTANVQMVYIYSCI